MKSQKSKVKSQKFGNSRTFGPLTFDLRLKSGFALIEMLIYIFLLSLLLLVVINSLLIIVGSYRNIKATQVIESSSADAMDRMITEIRNAKSVDTANTTYNTNPGILTLNTSTTTPSKIKFYVNGSTLRVDEDGVYSGPLISTDARIKTLIFRSISTTTSAAVKIEMEVESGTSSSYKSKKFYDTGILRGSY